MTLLQRIRRRFRLQTARHRVLPDFIIVGAQKAGTTSLFRYLCSHPAVLPPERKEVHYFDLNFDRSLVWYRSFFAFQLRMRLKERRVEGRALTGESSPYYLFHPAVPARVRHTVPDVRLIALLRNPVDRAYSHYQHERRQGREPLSFEEAISREPERLREVSDSSWEADGAYHAAHHRFAYLQRGFYVDQIERWLAHFNRNSLLIIRSEDFFRNEQRALDDVHAFLGLKQHDHSTFPTHLKGGYSEPMSDEIRSDLERVFRPYNERLAQLLGREFDW